MFRNAFDTEESMKIGLVLLPALLLTASVFSDDTHVRMETGGITYFSQLQDKHIALQSETIVMNLHDESYDVDVDFSFFNDGADVTYDIGFPVRAYDFNNPHRSWDKQIPISGFHTSVNGQEVDFVKNDGSAEDNVIAWYTKKVPFGRHSATHVSVGYSTDYGQEGGFGGRAASYYYGSGWIWKGPIGLIDLTIINRSKHEIYRVVNSQEKAIPTIAILDDLTTEFKYRSIEPEKNATLEIYLGPLDSISVFEGIDTKGKVIGRDSLILDTPFQLFIWRNLIYAANGLVFEADDLKKFFIGLPWYKPEKANVDSLLNDNERKSIENIKNLEWERAIAKRQR